MNEIPYRKTTKDDMEILMKLRLEMLREVNDLSGEYEYDENGNNIKEIYWVKDRKQGYRLCSETMKKYEKNQLIETEKNLYDKDGIIYENERQTNQYDEYGNVVENVIYKNGELFRSFKWQYIYNEFGLIETRSYYVDDMLSWVEKNEYSQK